MLFFELLQVALGNRDRLIGVPSAEEWTDIYAESERQAVTGILLHGIDRLPTEQRPPQSLLLQWIMVGQMIEKRNLLLDEHCKKLIVYLSSVGLHPTILKGQGIARYYSEPLQRLRQSGDIDVYVNDGREKAVNTVEGAGLKVCGWDYKHAHIRIWKDTEVELHYRVEVLLNLWKNRKLQRWFDVHAEEMFGHTEITETTESSDGHIKGHTEIGEIVSSAVGGKGHTESTEMVTPTVEFNVFYILLHIYRHFLYEGIGLRQIVDYYMVLRTVNDSRLMVNEYVDAVRELRMMKFAKGLMWVMHETMGMPDDWMLWNPDEKEGRYILKQVMMGGNFGHHDERLKHSGGKLGAVRAILTHNLHLLTHYPSDVVWAPVWIVWHKVWKMTRI